jgi:hypothetical protein
LTVLLQAVAQPETLATEFLERPVFASSPPSGLSLLSAMPTRLALAASAPDRPVPALGSVMDVLELIDKLDDLVRNAKHVPAEQ